MAIREKYEPQIQKPKDRQVTAFDFFGKKHKRRLKNFKFRPGAYGVLITGQKILLERHPLLKTFGLPGGGVEIGESLRQGMEREFKEETGLKVKAEELLGIVEDFFTFRGTDVHGILIFYKVKKISGKLLPNGNGWDTGEVKFMDIKKLTQKNSSRSQWPFIRNLKNLPKTDL
jgi:ADP-ribose pyrophosphatase YjhB (NUDIX family)